MRPLRHPGPDRESSRPLRCKSKIPFLKDLIYLFLFWLHSVFVAVHGFSLEAESGDYSLVAVYGLMVASLAAEHRL